MELLSIPGLPEVRPGQDLSELLCTQFAFRNGDVLVLAQKVVSKSEGRLTLLAQVHPSEEARTLAETTGKDPRLVQLILDESSEIVRVRAGTIIVRDRRGWVCANAGIDRSNVVQEHDAETVCLLPLDPDKSALMLRKAIQERAGVSVAVIIADSHGRAWREGTVGVAIGVAGMDAVSDRRGRQDRHGYVLQHTLVATADELAAAASLLMGQGDESQPAVVIRGLSPSGDGNSKDLQRPVERDLFR